MSAEKQLVWMGSSLKDIRQFPDEVKQVMGYALWLAQQGDKHVDAKPLKGFGATAVMEVVEDYSGDTYRAVYTAKLKNAVYVLHSFQKKSKKGIATARQDLEVIRQRFQEAQRLDKLGGTR